MAKSYGASDISRQNILFSDQEDGFSRTLEKQFSGNWRNGTKVKINWLVSYLAEYFSIKLSETDNQKKYFCHF